MFGWERKMDMEIWSEFDEFVQKMFYFVNGKQVVLWGYESSGFFIEHLFSRSNRRIEYIVEDMSLNPKIRVMRSIEIEHINPCTCAVILSGDYDEQKNDFWKNVGLRKT